MKAKTPDIDPEFKKAIFPQFIEISEQALFSKIMGVLPISGPNEVYGYLLVFNISGRLKYCLLKFSYSSELKTEKERNRSLNWTLIDKTVV